MNITEVKSLINFEAFKIYVENYKKISAALVVAENAELIDFETYIKLSNTLFERLCNDMHRLFNMEVFNNNFYANDFKITVDVVEWDCNEIPVKFKYKVN